MDSRNKRDEFQPLKTPKVEAKQFSSRVHGILGIWWRVVPKLREIVHAIVPRHSKVCEEVGHLFLASLWLALADIVGLR